MTEAEIQRFLGNRNYDLRQSGNGRWIDQKCTPDVVWSIADFVLNYDENISNQFNASDIWKSEYAKRTIKETFSKPETDDISAESEYDKVFSQPLCMLCYAGILEDVSERPGRHLYQISNKEVLEYIAKNDICSLRFLQMYIEKVLSDSNMKEQFDTFFALQTQEAFTDLKEFFINFYHLYTPINGDYEPRRIFTKVLNPLAFKKGARGTEHGRLSRNNIVRSDMMYNRDNFRDVFRDKPKEISRKDWLEMNPEIDVRNGYFEQMMASAKRQVKKTNDVYRNGLSELSQFDKQHFDPLPASQLHHIFPRNEFPDIMHRPENIIALTPNQHLLFAHPNNNTSVINYEAQRDLLNAKTYSIKMNLSGSEDPVYDFTDFLEVLKTGWSDINVLQIPDGDYNGILHSICYHYEQG